LENVDVVTIAAAEKELDDSKMTVVPNGPSTTQNPARGDEPCAGQWEPDDLAGRYGVTGVNSIGATRPMAKIWPPLLIAKA
jgi:hypothetical protein